MRKLVVRQPGPEGRFQKEWKWNPQKRALENLSLGVTFQVVDVVFEDTGEIKHEGIVPLSRRAELHVVVRNDGYIGMVHHRRELVIPPSVSQQIFSTDPSKIPEIQHIQGIEEYECPRGLAVRKLEEAEEEVGSKIAEAHHIGFIIDSSSLGGTPYILFATLLSPCSSGKKPEVGEQIIGITFFPPDEVRNIPTICGITQAALWRFRAWGLNQPRDSFWYSVAEKL